MTQLQQIVLHITILVLHITGSIYLVISTFSVHLRYITCSHYMYIHVLLKIFFYLFSSTEFQQFSELCILTNNIFIHKCIDASPLYLWVLNQFKLLHVFTLSIPISLRVNTELIYIHVYNYTCTCIYIYIYIYLHVHVQWNPSIADSIRTNISVLITGVSSFQR